MLLCILLVAITAVNTGEMARTNSKAGKAKCKELFC